MLIRKADRLLPDDAALAATASSEVPKRVAVRRLSICGIALLTAALLSLSAGQAQAQVPTVWILSTAALQNVTANPTIAQNLSTDTVYQVVNPGAADTPVTSNAIIAYHEYSGAKAASDVENGLGATGGLPSDTGAILLDQEFWQNGT